MKKSRLTRAGFGAVAGAVGVSLVLAACSSSSSSTPTPGGSSGGDTTPIKVGLIWPETGAAAPGYTQSNLGAKARIQAFNDAGGLNGRKIELVEADDASSVDGVLTGVKKLIDQENVYAILMDSPFFSAASRYATQKGVPVFGYALGPEWADPANTNMFSFSGTNYVPQAGTDTDGKLMAALGGTTLGTIGYGQSESSQNAAKNSAKSAIAAGLTAPYVNTSVPFGAVDFNAIALAMKDKGVDTVTLPLNVNSSVALLSALRQAGSPAKVALIYAGYGADFLKDTNSVAAAEGAYFYSQLVPFSADTAATQTLAKNLSGVGWTGDVPTGIATSYMGADLFIFALNRNGGDLSQADFITKTRAITDYDGAGLIGDPTKPIDLSKVPSDSPPGWCAWWTRLQDGKFVTVPEASPACGNRLPD